MTNFKGEIGAKEAILDVKVIVLPLLSVYKWISRGLLIGLFPFIACQKESTISFQMGFYHWQTVLDLADIEMQYLDHLPIEQLYIKFFDVDWDFNQQTPLPHASLQVKTSLPLNLEIIPTIFITNRTLQYLSNEGLVELGENIADKVLLQLSAFPNHSIKHLQIDCDWSLSTKAKYFDLLTILKKRLRKEHLSLSATLRLHQIKYFEKTGIPPVKRGVLMFYNMGEVTDISTKNSILDLAIAKKYIAHLKTYPLPLDLALPLFHWGVVFRSDKMTHLLNQISMRALEDASRFQQIEPNKWRVLKGTYLNGTYLYKNDWIRVEKSTYKDLEAALLLLAPHFEGKNGCIIFYHLEKGILNTFSLEEIKKLQSLFNR